ncbi:MAG: Gfo/Idh/MocA family oxidoreductase [Chitinophagaceae bacterium]
MAEKNTYTDRPIYIIGAGGIVNAAHLPAYAIAGYPVVGIYDIDEAKAAKTASDFTIPEVYSSLQQMLDNAPVNAVFDIAVPGSAIADILNQLPAKAALLMQKPMGEDLASAKKILEICRQKEMIAAVNFQLRYAPFIKQARRMIDEGMLGEIYDIEVNVNVFTPWHLWNFLFTAPRMEIVYHSIHYIDLVRSFLGNPTSIYAKTIQHPSMTELASVRSNIIMDYGMQQRANILTNHCHVYGKQRQQSYIKIEGSKGAIKIHFGVLKNYPEGESDRFEYILMEDGKYNNWKTKAIKGSWFPHAFIGSMEQVLLAADGKIQQPDNSVEDCIHTMACVEAAYISSAQGGVRPDEC